MTSPDLTDANIAKLAELFPSVVTESLDEDGNPKTAIDFDLLRQELSDHVVEGPQERYQLDWPGKRAAAFAANAPIAKTLRPDREDSVDFDTTKNLFIEGDNLDALKLLQESYLGKVKLIYIDPPYNTGNDFVYKDNFAETADAYLNRSGQTDDEGTRLVTNTEANGRFHSDWLSMMYPRLRLARNLLSGDGIICVSIDDNERDALKLLMDEVYSPENFIGTLVWRRRTGAMDAASNLSLDHEYVMVYSRSGALLNGKARTYEKYTNPDNDVRGPWILDNLSAGKPGGDTYYEIQDPSTGMTFLPPKGRYWPYSRGTMATKIAEGRVVFPGGPDGTPMLKRFKSEAKRDILPVSSWIESDSNRANQSSLVSPMNSAATKSLSTLLDGKTFNFPKSVDFVRNLVSQATDSDSIVLDFFSGSGTTAHAVMDTNARDGGYRSQIQVQFPEKIPVEPPAVAGFKSIADIAKERIRRAAGEIRSQTDSDRSDHDFGFRVLKVDTTNMANVSLSPDETGQLELGDLEGSVKPDRSGEDLLFQVLLDWGLELTMPITVEKVDDHEVFDVDDGALIACFDSEVSLDLVRTIAKREPLRAVFCDSSFASDDARINAEQIFREVSAATDVKTI